MNNQIEIKNYIKCVEFLLNCEDDYLITYFNDNGNKSKSNYEIIIIKFEAYLRRIDEGNEKIKFIDIFSNNNNTSLMNLPKKITKKNIKTFRLFLEKFNTILKNTNPDDIYSADNIAENIWQNILQLSNIKEEVNLLSNCMIVICIHGNFIIDALRNCKLISNSFMIDETISKITNKVYHITLEYDNIDTIEYGKYNNICITGIGNYTNSDGEYFSWLVVLVNSEKSNKNGRYYHISISYPNNKAGKISNFVKDESNNIIFDTFYSIDKLISFPVLKNKMNQGITKKDHITIGSDFDNTGGIVDTTELISINHPDISVDEFGKINSFNWLRSIDVMTNYTVFGPLAKSLMISFGEINFFTSRRMELELSIEFEKILQNKADDLFGKDMIVVSFSTQKIKKYEKSIQAQDKLSRANDFFDNPKHFIFCEDDTHVIDEMQKNNTIVLSTYDKGETIELLLPTITRDKPIVIGLISPIAIGKTTVLEEIIKRAKAHKSKFSYFSTDILNMKGLGHKAYDIISREISNQDGGIVFADSGFTSGKLPIWLTSPFLLNHNSNLNLLLGLSLIRSMLRQEHPTLKFHVIHEIKELYFSNNSSKINIPDEDSREKMNADTLVNSFKNYNDLLSYLESKNHYCRADELDTTGNPINGTSIVIGYLNEGAKNYKDKWGLEMRHRAYTLLDNVWICHKPGFPIGVEVGEFSEDYNPDSFTRLHTYHQTIIELINKKEDLPKSNNGISAKMSWKIDGQFYQLIILTNKLKDIWREKIRKSKDMYALSLAAITKDKGYLLMIATNGTSVLKDQHMWKNLISAICGSESIEENTYSALKPHNAWNKFCIPFMERFCNMYESLEIHQKSSVPFAINFEATNKNRRNPWDKIIATELASIEDTNFKATGVYIDGIFEPHFIYSELLSTYSFNEPTYCDCKSSHKIEDLKYSCNEIIESTRSNRNELILQMFKKYGFPENSVFHPEGWVLFVWLDNNWVYCKIKIDWFYPAHQPLEKSLNKLLSLPIDAEDFYPKVGEAYAFRDTTKHVLPIIIQNTKIYLKNLIDDFYQIGSTYDEDNMIENKLPTEKFMKFIKFNIVKNILFNMEAKSIASMLKNINRILNNDLKRILNNNSISCNDNKDKQILFFSIVENVIPSDSTFYSLIDSDLSNDLFSFLKLIVLTQNLKSVDDIFNKLKSDEIEKLESTVKKGNKEESRNAKDLLQRNKNLNKISDYLYLLLR